MLPIKQKPVISMRHLHIYIPSNSIISHLQLYINESEEYSTEMLVSMKQRC